MFSKVMGTMVAPVSMVPLSHLKSIHAAVTFLWIDEVQKF